MDDKTRILMAIIRDLYHTGNWTEARKGTRPRTSGAYFDWGEFSPEVGSLVLCMGSSVRAPHEFTVGFVHKVVQKGECYIREIGSDRLCRVHDEIFIPIKGISPSDLWEGAQRQFYCKVLKAFKKGDEWNYLFGGLAFDGDNAKIWVRARYGRGGNGSLAHPAKPFAVTMKWNKRTTIKAILEVLCAGGYGTHEYEIDTEEEAREKGI